MASFIGSIWLRLFATSCLLFLGPCLNAQTAHYSGAQSTLPSFATYPYGVAVDTSGNVWVVDNLSGDVSEVTPAFAYLAANGNAVLSGLNSPYGIAVDTHGNLFITQGSTDGSPHSVIKETVVPTPYGNTYRQSVVTATGLNSPEGIAVDAQGNVYVADTDHNRVVKETPSGSSYIQSTLPTSTLSVPAGVAVDAGGNVYIADTGNNRVLKETLSTTGDTESIVASQLAKAPFGVAVDGSGDVFILAYSAGGYAEDYFVAEETPSPGGYTQSAVSFAGYQNPYGIAVDSSGDVFIASPGGDRLKELVPGAGNFGRVNLGTPPGLYIPPVPISLIFTIDTPGTLSSPAALTQGATGLDFTNPGSGSCGTQGSGFVYAAGDACSIDIDFIPQWAGSRNGAAVLRDAVGNTLAAGYVHGVGVAPQVSFLPATSIPINLGLAHPRGVAVDASGNVYFAENASGTLYKDTRSGNTYNSTVIAAGLNHPTAVALDGAGDVYVAAGNTLYKETPAATHYIQSAVVTSPGELLGIAADGSGNLYLTSSASGDVHKETLQTDGAYSETAIGFTITAPAGLAVDGSGNIFVTDPHQGDVYKETLAANGAYIQSKLAGGIDDPESLALDGGGNVYVISSNSGQVYKEALQTDGAYTQSIVAARLNGPQAIALDGPGNLYISLDFTGELAKIDVVDPPVFSFNKTSVGSTSTDSPQLLTVSNIGNSPLYIPFTGTGPDPAISSSFTLASATTCPKVSASAPTGSAGTVAAGASCIYAIDFAPAVAGPVRSSLGLVDNNLNQENPYAKQSIELREGITSDATRTTVRVSPDQIRKGLGITITVTVVDTSAPATTPQGGGVTFTDTVSGKETALDGGAAVLLTGGKATLNMIPSIAGEHTITAHYTGVNASLASSTGEALLTVLR